MTLFSFYMYNYLGTGERPEYSRELFADKLD